MPYDGLGNFTRNYNWTADKLAGIKIESERMDGEFDNFAAAMNQVMLRNGSIPWGGDLKMGGNKITGLASGTAASPGLQFLGDTTTGLYMPVAGTLGFSANGVERANVSASGLTVAGNVVASKIGVGELATPLTPLHISSADARIRLQNPSRVWDTQLAGTDYVITEVDVSERLRISGASITLTGNLKAVGQITAKSNAAFSAAGNAPFYTWHNADQTTRYGYFQHTGEDFVLANEVAGGEFYLQLGGANTVSVSPNGNVAITAPGGVGAVRLFHAGGSANYFDADYQTFRSKNGAVEYLTIDPPGNLVTVGSGLSVAGGVNVRGGQVAFPAVQVPSANPNTLDDYEEGTFVPALAIGGVLAGITYSFQSGWYTKIGRQVSVSGQVTLTDKGVAVGTVSVAQLPFINVTPHAVVGAVTLHQMSAVFNPSGLLGNGANGLDLYTQDVNAVQLTNTALTHNSTIWFNVTYFTST